MDVDLKKLYTSPVLSSYDHQIIGVPYFQPAKFKKIDVYKLHILRCPAFFSDGPYLVFPSSDETALFCGSNGWVKAESMSTGSR